MDTLPIDGTFRLRMVYHGTPGRGLVADLFGNLRIGTILGTVMAGHIVGMAIGSYAGGITYEITGIYLTIFIIQGLLEFVAASFAFTIRRA